MKTSILGFTTACAIALGGCAMEEDLSKPSQDDTKGGAEGKADAWGPNDAPGLFGGALKYKLADLPQQGEATNIPWAANYWPTYQDNINHRWDGANTLSPAAKYGLAFGVANIEDKVSQHYGIDRYKGSRTACTDDSQCNRDIGEACAKRTGATDGVCIPTWWGICHAWAPLAVLKPEPLHAVDYNYTDASGEQKTVHFKVNDIKALLELAYNSTETKFVSLRCNLNANNNEITWDAYGRPSESNKECKDTNPGTLHVLVTNYLGIQGASFVYDRTYDDEVWNQPVRGYRITKQVEVTAREANTLIGVTSEGSTTTELSGSVSKGEWKHFDKIAVSAGQPIVVAMTGTNDADLHVRFGAQSTANAYDCRPYDGGSNETCELIVPDNATEMYVSVNGYSDEAANVSINVRVGGATPDRYHFNDQATKFFHVKMELDYITESAAETDGNLAAEINRYTRTDRYEYILELKDDGTIIGGEYIGDSKRNHPDFLWLPIRRRNFAIAGGALDFAKINELYERSRQTNEPPTTGGLVELTKNGTVNKAQWSHYGPFEVAAGEQIAVKMTGTGDADLYVRKGAAPTSESYDCRPYKGTSTEECTLVGPGSFYVSVNGYRDNSNFELAIKYVEGTGTTPPVEPPATVSHLNVREDVELRGEKRYTVDVRAGEKIFIRTFSEKDVDLYIQMGAAPTTDAYLMRAWTTSGNEVLSYTPTSNGTLHILVHGYQSGTFTLRTAAQ